MKPFTVQQLRTLFPSLALSKAAEYEPLLRAAMEERAINTRARACAFLAQIAHESEDLTRWLENMNYSAPRLLKVFPRYFTPKSAAAAARKPAVIANRVYGGRMGNINPGDGFRYIARGPIGLTGRSNYAQAAAALQLDLVEYPALAQQPEHGFRIAAWFWSDFKRLNPTADRLTLTADAKDLAQFDYLTIAINGGLNGQTDRRHRYARAVKVLPPGQFQRKGHECQNKLNPT